MEDDTSTTPVTEEVQEQPADDQVLSILNDTEDEAPAEVEETSEEEAPEAETPPEGETTEEEAEDLQPEVDPKEEARRRYEERQAAKAEREARVAQIGQSYVDEAENDVDARMRQIEVDRYNEKIENTENTLKGEFERAKADPDLQIFNPDNKELFNPRAYDKTMRDYNAGYIEYDSNGFMVGVKGSLIEHLTETAEILQGAIKSGAVQQVRDTRRMRSSADVKPAATPKEPAKDTILETLQSD